MEDPLPVGVVIPPEALPEPVPAIAPELHINFRTPALHGALNKDGEVVHYTTGYDDEDEEFYDDDDDDYDDEEYEASFFQYDSGGLNNQKGTVGKSIWKQSTKHL
jgi:hypothetical protein